MCADLHAQRIMQSCSKVPVVTYPMLSRTADVFARTMRYNSFETEVEVRTIAYSHHWWTASLSNTQQPPTWSHPAAITF